MFGSMFNLTDPFLAQPPLGFNTGHFCQFAPRVNFTAKHENVPADTFRQECGQTSGPLYLHYENMTNYGGYIVDVCMPAGKSTQLFKATSAWQDFSEELYVKMA